MNSLRAADGASHVILVIDDDYAVRNSLKFTLEVEGFKVRAYSDAQELLNEDSLPPSSCLVTDYYMPAMNGLELLKRLRDSGDRLPAIMITGNSDVPMAVEAMKAGASDFLEKPIRHSELLASVARALEQSRDGSKLSEWQETAADCIATLTPRELQIMELVLAGQPSKNIAADLGISQRTVENHRASIMEKTGSKSLPALARLALAAGQRGAEGPQVQPGTPATTARRTAGK